MLSKISSAARLLLCWCVITVIGPARAQQTGWNVAQQGGFVVSLARDARGAIWAGTEDHGVSRFASGQWTSFGAADGLGDDDVYAVTGDRLGRVWVGHLNHGVSVWNGQTWRNYGVGQGPLGERVFDLATSPVDGDVWIAHNAGLTRYSVQNDNWTQFAEGNGFPAHEISALAFDSAGKLYVGTQHQGVTVGSPTDNFASWTAHKGATQTPNVPSGEGLPSNCINDILVAGDNTVYAATDTGLATSKDGGEHWTFIRGRDWKAKAGADAPADAEEPEELLGEDYVTCLAQDARGLLWIGYRRGGYEARRPLEGLIPFYSPDNATPDFPYVSAILPLDDGSVTLGYYNQGAQLSVKIPPFAPTPAEQKWARADVLAPQVPTTTAALPTESGAPSLAQLQTLLDSAKNRVANTPPVVSLPDDWTTQGTWRGRYGRYFAILSAMITAPYDYLWGAGAQPVEYAARTGPKTPDAGLRYYVAELSTADPRALEMPSIYLDSRVHFGTVKRTDDVAQQKYRRQSEWNDFGQELPITSQDPDIFVTLKIPDGNYVLSLFDRNKDGHDGLNRARDYLLSVRPHDGADLRNVDNFDGQPELASARLRDFWGSSWKKFAVRGPRELTVKVDRNYSFNTMLSGVFLDEINEEPDPYFDTATADAGTQQWNATDAQPADAVAEQLWAELQRAQTDDPIWWVANGRVFYEALLRFYQPALERTDAAHQNALWRRIGTCYYALNQYENWEAAQRKRGLTTARDIETSLRWDGKLNTDGRGHEIIAAYRQGGQEAVNVLSKPPETEAEINAATSRALKRDDWGDVAALQEQLLALNTISPEADWGARVLQGNALIVQNKPAEARKVLEVFIAKDYPDLSPAQETSARQLKQSSQLAIAMTYVVEENPTKAREVIQNLLATENLNPEISEAAKAILETFKPELGAAK